MYRTACNQFPRPAAGDPTVNRGRDWGDRSIEESLSQLPGPEDRFPWPLRFKVKIINDDFIKKNVKS